MFDSKQMKAATKSRDLSSLYVEIHESFLPEPLILTILMESKSTPYHLSVEKNNKNT
jgi:hypothetical protein